MFEFFKKNKPQKDVAETEIPYQGGTAPGTSIHYQNELIPHLKSEHNTLLTVYDEIGKAVKKNDFELASSKLADFKRNLLTHLLAENIRLYVYLEHCFVNDSINSILVHDFRKEMALVGKIVMGFLKKYQSKGIDDKNVDSFMNEFVEIGRVLQERIQKEEVSLYPLYMPVEELSK